MYKIYIIKLTFSWKLFYFFSCKFAYETNIKFHNGYKWETNAFSFRINKKGKRVNNNNNTIPNLLFLIRILQLRSHKFKAIKITIILHILIYIELHTFISMISCYQCEIINVDQILP